MSTMTRVWERLYVGSLADAEALAENNLEHIDSVISLSLTQVRKKRNDVNYLHLPVEDAQQIPVGQFDAVMDAIAENIRWGKVLVNCGQGVSRAPIMTAAWMHVVGYRDIDAALDEIKKLRQIINPSDILLASVKEHLG